VTGRNRRRAAGPVVLFPLAGVAIAFVALPFLGLLQRAPWSDLGSHLDSAVVRDALRLSLLTALAATALSLVFGVPLAWVLARGTFRGRSVLRAMVTLPMVLPPVVGGAALLFTLGRRGLVGQYLDSLLSVRVTFTTAAVVLANTVVAMPFLVVTVEAALRGADRRYEEAAATLGARPWTVFRRVTLPLIAPSIGAGAVLCWARALGEFGATVTFAGSLQGRTQTMPVAVYQALERDRDAAIVLSLILVVVSLTILALLRDRWFPVST
jgi:molybdate transport system permease protein